jgi:hypothetical protein
LLQAGQSARGPTQVQLGQHLSVEASTLNSQPVQLPLLVAFAEDIFLNGVGTDQTVDVHLTRLTNAMAAILMSQTEQSIAAAAAAAAAYAGHGIIIIIISSSSSSSSGSSSHQQLSLPSKQARSPLTTSTRCVVAPTLLSELACANRKQTSL